MLEQLIREKAYSIWEAEGYPEGRAEAHWELAKRVLETPAEKTRGKASKPRGRKAKG